MCFRTCSHVFASLRCFSTAIVCIHCFASCYHTSHQAIAGILVVEPALAWEATVPSTQLGVHVDNRSGALASLRQALVTGAKHCKAGYSYRSVLDRETPLVRVRDPEFLYIPKLFVNILIYY